MKKLVTVLLALCLCLLAACVGLENAAPAGQEPKSDALVEPEEQSRFGQQREKNALQRELQEAVECENYERAAELRDQIRALEK